MTFPDPPTPEQVLRFRESELRTAAQFWHADPSEENAAWLHGAVEKLHAAQRVIREAQRGRTDQ